MQEHEELSAGGEEDSVLRRRRRPTESDDEGKNLRYSSSHFRPCNERRAISLMTATRAAPKQIIHPKRMKVVAGVHPRSFGITIIWNPLRFLGEERVP